ncbi:MAG: NADH:flavin oxidoreductase [Sphingopyxis sp.]|jgi:2,4-dienoyl-CoA reductase-like NADH-dependent reductase (Old Yellow Enzyme family)|nr:NADH:flavin oxidoreductase [Sphingopyxis sp.]
MTGFTDTLSFTRGPAMANRFMLAPLTNFQSHADGTLSDEEYRWLTKRAEGGFALTMTCASHVSKGGQGFEGQLGSWSDAHIPGLSRLAQGITGAGSLSAVQLHHAGERADAARSGEDIVAPWDGGEFHARALTTAEVEGIVADFTAGAVRAEQAGFDGVELHGAHGYLLCSFLSAAQNLRSDGWGGDYAGRTRIFWAIIDAIRASTRADFQLGVRLSPERYGMPIDESLRFAEELMTSGRIDYLDMSLWDCFKPSRDRGDDPTPLIDLFARLERGTTRLGVAGKITDAPKAQACLDAGADFVLIGRGAILHHDFPRRAMADPAFAATPLPVTRAYLAAEALGPRFIDYMATGWGNFVAEENAETAG